MAIPRRAQANRGLFKRPVFSRKYVNNNQSVNNPPTRVVDKSEALSWARSGSSRALVVQACYALDAVPSPGHHPHEGVHFSRNCT